MKTRMYIFMIIAYHKPAIRLRAEKNSLAANQYLTGCGDSATHRSPPAHLRTNRAGGHLSGADRCRAGVRGSAGQRRLRKRRRENG